METPQTATDIGNVIVDVLDTAPYESDPRRPSVKLAHAVLGVLDGQVLPLAQRVTEAEAALAGHATRMDSQDATMAAHADKLAAHDGYEARIAALEAKLGAA